MKTENSYDSQLSENKINHQQYQNGTVETQTTREGDYISYEKCQIFQFIRMWSGMSGWHWFSRTHDEHESRLHFLVFAY